MAKDGVRHRETARHQEAFEVWYAAGRDLKKVEEKFGVSNVTGWNWQKWFSWKEKADRRDREAMEQADRDAIRRRADMLRRHRQAAELLTQRGIQHFAQKGIETARDAIAAIKTGVELERQAEGLPAWVVEILNADEGELRRRLADLDARRRAATGGDPESAGDALALAGAAGAEDPALP